eukprot:5763643-Amphidinium_carterae.1
MFDDLASCASQATTDAKSENGYSRQTLLETTRLSCHMDPKKARWSVCISHLFVAAQGSLGFEPLLPPAAPFQAASRQFAKMMPGNPNLTACCITPVRTHL